MRSVITGSERVEENRRKNAEVAAKKKKVDLGMLPWVRSDISACKIVVRRKLFSSTNVSMFVLLQRNEGSENSPRKMKQGESFREKRLPRGNHEREMTDRRMSLMRESRVRRSVFSCASRNAMNLWKSR